MTATDQTYYNLRRLHRIFAGCSVLLLVVTIALVLVDHHRPWKRLQRTGDRIAATLAKWRQVQLASVAATGEREQCEAALRELRSRELSPELLTRFRAEVDADAARRGAPAPTWGALEAAVRQLAAAAAVAQATRATLQTLRLEVDQTRLDVEDAAAHADRLPPASDLLARYEAAQQRASQALQDRCRAEEAVWPLREAVFAQLHSRVDEARFREELVVRQRRLAQTRQDVARSRFSLAVRDGQPTDVLGALEEEIRDGERQLEQYTREIEVAAQHREQLQSLLQQLRAPEEELQKHLDRVSAESRRLQTLADEKRSTFVTFRGWLPLPGKRWLELPFLDAFNSPRKITNLWCAGLDQPLGSFGRVRRFDRCVTCHTAIDTALPEAPHAPRLGPVQTLDLALDVPLAPQPTFATPDGEPAACEQQLLELLGLQLAAEGLLDPNDVTVMLVYPASPAARARPWQDIGATALGRDVREQALQTLRDTAPRPAVPGLLVGDVLVAIEDQRVPQGAMSRAWVIEQLTAAATRRTAAGTADPPPPVRVTVRRGLPHPYAGHPRLDLFVGPHSPHPMQSFGCTVCHEGQGSATSFRWAAHTPNDAESRRRWAATHDWSANPHWDFPMLPQRFAESLCLKCHHQVLDLEPSERFPDPPAPRVVEGYHLVRRLGCFGCHEINGYDDAARQVAPDLRLEPNGYAPHSTADERGTDTLPPGTLRKVGASLRYVAAKLDPAFLVDWIGNPARFRPDTTMPRAFGLWNHLPARGLGDDVEARRESLAIYSVALYLRERSLPFSYVDPPRGVTPVTTLEEQQLQLARGRIAFEESGCLVCHNHADFPDFAPFRDADAVHLGPDLSRTAAKFAAPRNPNGARWLYDWIQDPARYDPRTTMPSMQLAPIEQRDADGRVVAVTDPVADIVAYLMQYRADDWTPSADAAGDAAGHLSPERLSTLEELTVLHLRDVTSPATAERFAREGIPAALKDQWQGPEQELVVEPADGQPLTEDEWNRRRLFYVARKTLLANGCYACHDIPGTEEAKPIGPTLTGWGRKNPAELAFGHVLQYVQPGRTTPSPAVAETPTYYLDELRAQSRIGFLYQKLSEPRSFDFLETDQKKYTARLRMPQFQLTPQQREAIATFVLGLVSDPPTSRFAYQPDTRTAALIAGQDLLHTFQCRGCHVMEPDTWELAFAPDTFGQQRQTPPHPFVPAGVHDQELATSRDVDLRGWRRAVLRGMPKLADDGRAEILDPLGDELAQLEDETFALEQLTYSFQLWRPAALDGWPYQVDDAALAIDARHIQHRRSARGGALARYLLPQIVQRDRAINPNVRGSQAWTWLPPPLLGEGTKVQPDWLHSYLLDPQPIRPAVAMRMPSYHLSAAEAQTLVDYFAAKDRAPYPYPSMPERTQRYLQLAAATYADRLATADGAVTASSDGRSGRGHLADAMRVVASSDYCIKCHQVGSYEPAGWNRAKAPDLAGVYRRLRADYLRTWLAHPAAVLPYTPMPVNIPYDPDKPLLGSTMSQDLYRGDTLEQLQALVDLLLNFDRYAIEQKRVVP